VSLDHLLDDALGPFEAFLEAVSAQDWALAFAIAIAHGGDTVAEAVLRCAFED
jgi:hypothetical protein